mgnify:CR=1 FL=1
MYEWLKYAFSLNMATIEQCEKAVEKGKITVEQFKEITGRDYPVTVE